ncbi:MAG: hypothetical protein DI537_08830 [Stutzerimonas stutzeri]|nr:MAG: hypothetical protein DI537_08830 [Stutzerimonas stutzeri]
MQDISLSYAVLLTGGAMLVGIASSYAVTRSQVATLAERLRSAEADIRQGQVDLAQFKLDAARRFVTDEMMTKVEERVVDAINRLGDRLDRILETRGGARLRGQSES